MKTLEAFKIGKRLVGPNHLPLIVAEMSGNHNQSLERALAIVDSAAKAGAHALKLQTYTADTITLDVREGDFVVKDPGSLWKNETLYDLYKKAHTPWDWHRKIFDRCRELGLICFSAPFDHTAVDFLEELGVPAYKIGSPENIDLPLIRKVSTTGKPVIISTGMASEEELGEAAKTARDAGCEDLVLLKCTSTYPADPSSTNILTIPDMRERFGVHVGISDHTLGVGVSVAAVALGVCVIEKHFTLARADGGVDSAFSMEPAEMRNLVDETHKAWQALGRVFYGPTESEKAAIRYRRSLYITKDLKAGEKLTTQNMRSIRPAAGLSPKFYDLVLGKTVTKDVKSGTPLSWDLINKKANQ